MRKSALILLATSALVVGGSAYAMPVGSSAMKPASDAVSPIEKSALYIVEGNRYCFYFDGWHGPGWYRCGFEFRRGLGWGGVYGWHGWRYGPAARRFGNSVTIREGRRGHREGVRGEIRERSTVREGRDHRNSIRGEGRERTTIRGREGTSARGEFKGRSETTGRGGPSAGVSGRGEIRSQGGSGGGAAKGGATVSPGGSGGRGGGAMHHERGGQ